MERFGEKRFDVEDLVRSLEEQGPYQNVFIQEMDVMNNLLAEMMRSLKELHLGSYFESKQVIEITNGLLHEL